jgi:hypothetical protein
MEEELKATTMLPPKEEETNENKQEEQKPEIKKSAKKIEPPTRIEVKKSLGQSKDNWTGKHRLKTDSEGNRMTNFQNPPEPFDEPDEKLPPEEPLKEPEE